MLGLDVSRVDLVQTGVIDLPLIER
jgi:hypothetical protein